MKKILLRALAFLLIMAFASCGKGFLEVQPKGKVIAGSYRDYDLLLNNSDLLNTGADAQLMMGDEAAVTAPYYSSLTLREQRLFMWNDKIYEPDENSEETNGPLMAIYTYNKIINEVMSSEGGTEAQRQSVLAEARAGRAWTYFVLINYYGRPYNEATAATDPGFPLITSADVTANSFHRATVQEVYSFIIEDLQQAIPALPTAITHRLRMSKPAAEALLGKVYVFMHRYQEALPLLQSSLQGLASAQIPVRLYDYNKAFAPGGVFMPVTIFGPNYPLTNDNEEVMYLRQHSNFHVMFNTLVATAATMALYAPDDLRLLLYSATPFPDGAPFPAGMQRRMAPSIVPFGVGLPEIYLLLAECKARNSDSQGAKEMLEILRSNRMPASAAAVPRSVLADKKRLLQFIIEERLREFALLGYRWFDMRRLAADPLIGNTTFSHTLYNANGSTTVFTFRPERFALKIPPRILNTNPGMEDNP